MIANTEIFGQATKCIAKQGKYMTNPSRTECFYLVGNVLAQLQPNVVSEVIILNQLGEKLAIAIKENKRDINLCKQCLNLIEIVLRTTKTIDYERCDNPADIF